ncbi:MAG: adenosylcobinamide-GDP ribazoletransferase [Pseudomonadota bacterium]|nr:adenosylcobinamide-GDP ribazoletransferase [Pseudomonadales bacterium]MDY6919355.1 adenosylcobinamide-GDP ribazoletransferase [Pseudomonadota bacterium]
MTPLLIAIQFLTRLPVARLQFTAAPGSEPPGPKVVRDSIYWYSSVGLLLGLILWLASAGGHWLLPQLNPTIMAALLLALWVWLSGALHLDGLADSADAWLGGRDPEHRLAIMKDPRCGSAGVVSVVLLLILKFACLSVLLVREPALVILAPTLARGAMPLLFLHTPYVRQQGLASPFSQGLRPLLCYGQLLLPVGLWCWFQGLAAVPGLAWLAVLGLGLRRSMVSRIGGTTGDTAGALIELLEAGALLAICAALPAAPPPA